MKKYIYLLVNLLLALLFVACGAKSSTTNPVIQNQERPTSSPDVQPTNSMAMYTYIEDHKKVIDYTYAGALYEGCFELTKTFKRGIYLYSTNYKENGKMMKRGYLKDNKLKLDYLSEKHYFINPFEDKEGSIYAECFDSQSLAENKNSHSICKMDSKGNIVSKIEPTNFNDKGLNFLKSGLVKKDVVALFFGKTDPKFWYTITQVQIVDIKNKS